MKSLSARLARSALDAAPDAMIIIDATGTICFANRQVPSLFGYSYAEIVGRAVELLMPERFHPPHVDHRQNYVANVRVRPMGAGLQLHGRRKDGTEFPVEVSLSPIEHESDTLVAAAIRDVTDRKRAEADLIEARETADRARELALQAREAADRASQGKTRFLAAASHDLRQPLQALALLNGSLKRMSSDPAVTELIVQQESSIGAMSRLLAALLDVSKLESGAVKPVPRDFPVSSLFGELRNEFAASAAVKGLGFEVTVGDEEVLHSDPSLIEQILSNLVSNAIKYTRQGTVALRCMSLPDRMLRLEVSDTGIRIPASQMQYIFDEFYQVGVAAHSLRDGYGLGLNIVQRLVKLLNVTLDVRSEVGKGSVFALLLPAGTERVNGTRTPLPGSPAQPAPAMGPRVLLVEDNPSVRSATQRLLAREGYQVTAVATLQQALDHAAVGNPIDLLVTDYHLANEEAGTTVITALRERLGVYLKAVLITGDTSSAVQELPRDPFMRIASKPLRADELLMLLRALLAA